MPRCAPAASTGGATNGCWPAASGGDRRRAWSRSPAHRSPGTAGRGSPCWPPGRTRRCHTDPRAASTEWTATTATTTCTSRSDTAPTRRRRTRRTTSGAATRQPRSTGSKDCRPFGCRSRSSASLHSTAVTPPPGHWTARCAKASRRSGSSRRRGAGSVADAPARRPCWSWSPSGRRNACRAAGSDNSLVERSSTWASPWSTSTRCTRRTVASSPSSILADVEHRIGIECQSWAWHSTPAAQRADARRKRAVRRIGWEIVDVWWSDLKRMDDVVETVSPIRAERAAR